jgi:hypothetical protein
MRRLFADPLDPVDPAGVYGDPPRPGPGTTPLRLCSVCEQDGFLFLHYRPGPDR